MFDHITMQVADVATSRQFYEAVLAPLGIAPLETDGAGIGFFGTGPGGFWLIPAESSECRELHVAFSAADRPTVDEFYRVAVAADIEVLHAPRLFPEYGPTYYGCFIRDPDGHNIEAVCKAEHQ